MALQPYVAPGSASATSIINYSGREISEEEQAKRIQDAEDLEKKLNYIQESIPTRVVQIMGSNAGAGSGEFHMYRQARRREQMRLERIEEMDKQHKILSEYEEKRKRQQDEEEERTAKRRVRRLKKKAKKKVRGVGAVAGAPAPTAGSFSESEEEAHTALD